MIVDVVANSSKSRLLMFLLLSKADQGINHVKGCAVGLAFRSLFPGSSPGGLSCCPCSCLGAGSTSRLFVQV